MLREPIYFYEGSSHR